MKTLVALGLKPSLLAASLAAAQDRFYDPKARRDPFMSPAGAWAGERPSCPGQGLAGNLVQEVALRGIVRTEHGRTALLATVDTRTYFATNGARLCDGRVLRIDADGIVFMRLLKDPLAPEKEVELRLLLQHQER